MQEAEVELFNGRLERLYPKDFELPRYRLVRAELQTEKRKGEFNIFSETGNIFLRKEIGVREVKKYPWMPDCWLLERIEFNNHIDVEARYTYEPIFPFVDKDKNPIAVTWSIIQFITERIEFCVRNPEKPMSEPELAAQEEKRMKEEEEKTFAFLDKPESTNELPTFKSSTLSLKGQ